MLLLYTFAQTLRIENINGRWGRRGKLRADTCMRCLFKLPYIVSTDCRKVSASKFRKLNIKRTYASRQYTYLHMLKSLRAVVQDSSWKDKLAAEYLLTKVFLSDGIAPRRYISISKIEHGLRHAYKPHIRRISVSG